MNFSSQLQKDVDHITSCDFANETPAIYQSVSGDSYSVNGILSKQAFGQNTEQGVQVETEELVFVVGTHNLKDRFKRGDKICIDTVVYKISSAPDDIDGITTIVLRK